MKKLVQINVVSNTGSTGRIMENIGKLAISNGWKSYVAFGRASNKSDSNEIIIGKPHDKYINVLNSRIFDNHGFNAKKATNNLVKQLEVIEPDIIHLHNIHGYYINIEILFKYLSFTKIPVVWTLHDCWSFTGHCSNFEAIDCKKWINECNTCPQLHTYPKSYVKDNSKVNFHKKEKIFNSINNLTIVPVSNWLVELLSKSYLKNNNIQLIHNGIDQKMFKPRNTNKISAKYNLNDKFIILGVAGIWNGFKGLNDFISLNSSLSENEQIVLIGLNETQIDKLPKGIIGIPKTESIDELAELYTLADVYVNLTYEDTFPTTNLEALACGTPVITYNTGGSPEAIDAQTGFIIPVGNISYLLEKIKVIQQVKTESYSNYCIKRAKLLFDSVDRNREYLNLYSKLLDK